MDSAVEFIQQSSIFFTLVIIYILTHLHLMVQMLLLLLK